MIEFSLPDFTVGLKRNLLFANIIRSNPEFFLPGVGITSMYGCFPNCRLNGGRAYVREPYTEAQMDSTFMALEQHGLRPRLTFTNMLVTPELLDDVYFNQILRVASYYDTEVIVYSDLVSDYIHGIYPSMRRTLSTTRLITEPEVMNRALERYDMVVLNYNLNKDDAFLRQVSDTSRIEVMANELCNPHCPHRQDHYRHNSQDQLDGKVTEFRRCNLAGVDFWRNAEASPTILANSDVERLYREYGIHVFKIVGRGLLGDLTLESLLYYLVRPEHRDGLRASLKTVL